MFSIITERNLPAVLIIINKNLLIVVKKKEENIEQESLSSIFPSPTFWICLNCVNKNLLNNCSQEL